MLNSILDLTEVKAKGRKSAVTDKSPAAAKSTGKKSRKMEKVAQVMPPHAIGAYIYFSNATFYESTFNVNPKWNVPTFLGITANTQSNATIMTNKPI